jgi:hypothetical protein
MPIYPKTDAIYVVPMNEGIDFTSLCKEHYLLGMTVGQLKFCGRWFDSRMPGNYPQMGADSFPMGIQGPFPSLKSLTLDTLPESPYDAFTQEVKEELDELFSTYKPIAHVSAERASAIMTLATSIEKRYYKSLTRFHIPYEESINKAREIIPTGADDFRSAID